MEAIHPDDRQQTEEAYDAASAVRGPVQTEFRLRCPDCHGKGVASDARVRLDRGAVQLFAFAGWLTKKIGRLALWLLLWLWHRRSLRRSKTLAEAISRHRAG